MKRYYFILLVTLPLLLAAHPTVHKVAQGDATFAYPSIHEQRITVGEQTIIHWDDFSIDAGEITRFVQPSKDSAVLNRVTSLKSSHLLGSLEANGKVYLINPNGIFIGPEGAISTNGFIASTLDILDKEFLANDSLNFKGASESAVVNLGSIHALDGDVILLGRFISNSGTIRAPKGEVLLGAGAEILLKPEGKERIFIAPKKGGESSEKVGIDSQGDIEALKVALRADGNAYKLAINHEGTIDALRTTECDGEVYLVADGGVVEVSGEMKAPSGKIYVLGQTVDLKENGLLSTTGESKGGDVFFGGSFKGEDRSIPHSEFTFVREGGTIDVSAHLKGNAGTAVVWSDGETSFKGAVYANGGREKGNGGTVEVSGGNYLDIGGWIERKAFKGEAGVLLTDPTDILITDKEHSPHLSRWLAPNGKPSLFTTCFLVSETHKGPVEITTHSSGNGYGNIIIDTDLDGSSKGGGFGSPYPLTLSADQDIIVRGNVQNIDDGDIILSAKRDIRLDGSDRISRVGSREGTTSISAGRHIILEGGKGGQAQIGFDDHNIKQNKILLSAGGNLTLLSDKNFTLIGNTYTGTPKGPLSYRGDIEISDIGGNLVLEGGQSSGDFAQIGHATQYRDTYGVVSDRSIAASGDITISNVGGNIHVQGGHKGERNYALIGHGGGQRSHNDTFEGNVIVNGKGDLFIRGGTGRGEDKFAGIGFAQDFDVFKTHTINGEIISVNVDGEIKLTGGHGGPHAAFIGIFTGVIPGKTVCNLEKIKVAAGKSIKLFGGSHPLADSVIGLAGLYGEGAIQLEVISEGKIDLIGREFKPGKITYAKIVNQMGLGEEKLGITIRSNEDLGLSNYTQIITKGPLNVYSETGRNTVTVQEPVYFYDPVKANKVIAERSLRNIERSQVVISEFLTKLHPMNESLGWMEIFDVTEKEITTYYLRMRNLSINTPRSTNILEFSAKEL